MERLDRFFSDEREVDLPRVRSFFRWRSDVRIRDDGSLAAATDLRAEVYLPAFDRRLERLQLAVTGSTVPASDRLLPGEAPPDALKRASAGLKLAMLESLHTSVDTQAGVLFQLPVGWYTRVRLRHLHPLPWGRLLAREAVSGFWQSNTGFGTRQDASLEQPILSWLLARLDATGTVTERSRGWEWETNGSLLAALGATTAASLSAGVLGATALGPVVEKYRVLARIRRDVVRRWIFVELEPELEWTRLPGGGRQRLRAVIVRLELQFDAAMLETGSDRSKVVW